MSCMSQGTCLSRNIKIVGKMLTSNSFSTQSHKENKFYTISCFLTSNLLKLTHNALLKAAAYKPV